MTGMCGAFLPSDNMYSVMVACLVIFFALCKMYTYPRTYGCLIKSLKAGLHLDNGEESQGESVYQSHLPDNHGWFR